MSNKCSGSKPKFVQIEDDIEKGKIDLTNVRRKYSFRGDFISYKSVVVSAISGNFHLFTSKLFVNQKRLI